MTSDYVPPGPPSSDSPMEDDDEPPFFGAPTLHLYVSTYCQHAHHRDCRLTCKVCRSPCLCPCHRR